MSIMTRIKHAAAAFRSDNSAWDTLLALLKGGQTASGVSVSADTILTLSAAYNAQVLVSETMSTIPLQIFRKSDDGRIEDDEHPLYEVLHIQANPTESAQALRQRLVWDLELHGIALAEIIRDGQRRIRQLWHVDASDLSQVTYENNQLQFHIGSTIVPAERMFYVYGPGQDGLTPRSRLKIMSEAAGLGMAANEFGARFFSNGTHLGGFIEHPRSLKDDMYERLKTSINEKYTGLGNANKVILLEEGMKFTPTGNTNEDSQFLETRQFQLSEIARFYNIPPHLIGDLEHATFSNIEHQGIQAVQYSWRPRAIRIEAAINTQLLPSSERRKVYAEHNLDGLMRGDFKSQMDALHLAVQDGIYNADEVRKLFNMSKQTNGQGSIYFMPANMYNKQDVKDGKTLAQNQPAITDGESVVDGNAAAIDEEGAGVTLNGAQVQAASAIVQAVAEGKLPRDAGLAQLEILFNLTTEQALRLMGSAGTTFKVEEKPKEDDDRSFESVADYRSYALSLIPSFAEKYKTRFSVDEYQKAIEKLLSAQEKRTKDGFGEDEYTRMRNAFTYAAMQASGVKAVVWRSKTDCPHCQHLNGQVRPLNEPFQDKIRHAPLVGGCDCDIEEADHA